MNSKYVKIGVVVIIIALVAAGTVIFSNHESKNDRIEKMGTVLQNGAKCGLAVPYYVADELNLHDISDLEQYSSQFKNEIIGIDAGAGIMTMTNNAMSTYGLTSFSLITSSETTMLTTLIDAYDSHGYVVVTMWEPHWVNGSYNLVFLNDTQNVYGEAESIESWGRPGMIQDDPILAEIVSNYQYNISEFNSLLSYIADSQKDIYIAAGEWVEAHPELLNKWLGDARYQSDRGEIKIGLVNWADAMGSSNALKYVLETYLGYKVTLIELNTGVMYAGLSNGEIDLITTAWLPMTHAQYIEKYT